MDRLADTIADLYNLPGRPAAGDTLEEAVWLDEQPLGYPLNLMCTLYYESSFCGPFPAPEERTQPTPENCDE